MWHHFRQAFRGQCDSSNRVLAIATTCVKNSSYPPMLRRHSRAHSTGSITAARGCQRPAICLLHTSEIVMDPFSVPQNLLRRSLSVHTPTSSVIRVMVESVYAGITAKLAIKVYALVPKTLNLFTPPSGMIIIFI